MTDTGIAGSPAESLSPSHGIEIRHWRRWARDSASVGRSAASPATRYGRWRRRSPSWRSAAPWDTTISSVAVPVGLWRRTAVLRPPTVALFSERLTTGRPSTSTSLYTRPAVGAPEPTTTAVPAPYMSTG